VPPAAAADEPTHVDRAPPGIMDRDRDRDRDADRAPPLDLDSILHPRGGPEPGAAPAPPVILDIVTQSLGIGTIAGYCDQIVRRNSRVPCEQKRLFTTSSDFQEKVHILVCQGDSRRIDDNDLLGEVVLEGIEPRPRGSVTIEVTFQVDAGGILRVAARDQETGTERRANVNLVGAQSREQVEAARARFQQLRS
jgi:molecular chaperone DnaK (HSP70)